MKIARLDERFKIKLGDVYVTVAPLSGRQKIEMSSMIKQDPETKKFHIDKASQELYLIKHSVKGIEGLKDNDENEYSLSFVEGQNCLTEECAEELLSFLLNTFFTFANTQAMKGLFGEVISPFDDKPIQGVSVERLVKKEDEKK